MQFHGYERDFTWPERGLVVEYDGWDGHKTRTQQEVDRRRDATLAVVNIPVIRITGLSLHLDPAWVLDTIGRALSAPRGSLDAEPVQQRVVAPPSLAHADP
jgi:very-short-patch-repair endonuclease